MGYQKYIHFILMGIVILLLSGIFMYLHVNQYYATNEDYNWFANNIKVENDSYYKIDHHSDKGLIFYPGGKVDPEAYRYLSNIDDANIYIAKFPYNLAFLDEDVALKIIEEESDVANWYIGGHSLGGVVANNYAQKKPELFTGVIFIGSYPQKAIPADSPLNYLTIYATEDKVIGDYQDKMPLFSANHNVKSVGIVGGNHSNFGNYGLQKYDSKAMISAGEQQKIIIDEITRFIEEN